MSPSSDATKSTAAKFLQRHRAGPCRTTQARHVGVGDERHASPRPDPHQAEQDRQSALGADQRSDRQVAQLEGADHAEDAEEHCDHAFEDEQSADTADAHDLHALTVAGARCRGPRHDQEVHRRRSSSTTALPSALPSTPRHHLTDEELGELVLALPEPFPLAGVGGHGGGDHRSDGVGLELLEPQGLGDLLRVAAVRRSGSVEHLLAWVADSRPLLHRDEGGVGGGVELATPSGSAATSLAARASAGPAAHPARPRPVTKRVEASDDVT